MTEKESLTELQRLTLEAIDRIKLKGPTRKEQGYDGVYTDFKAGDRVEVCEERHDFLRGDRFGVVKKVKARGVYVRLDRSGRSMPFDAANLRKVLDADERAGTGSNRKG